MPLGADDPALSLREGDGGRQHLLWELGQKQDFYSSVLLCLPVTWTLIIFSLLRTIVPLQIHTQTHTHTHTHTPHTYHTSLNQTPSL